MFNFPETNGNQNQMCRTSQQNVMPTHATYMYQQQRNQLISNDEINLNNSIINHNELLKQQQIQHINQIKQSKEFKSLSVALQKEYIRRVKRDFEERYLPENPTILHHSNFREINEGSTDTLPSNNTTINGYKSSESLSNSFNIDYSHENNTSNSFGVSPSPNNNTKFQFTKLQIPDNKNKLNININTINTTKKMIKKPMTPAYTNNAIRHKSQFGMTPRVISKERATCLDILQTSFEREYPYSECGTPIILNDVIPELAEIVTSSSCDDIDDVDDDDDETTNDDTIFEPHNDNNDVSYNDDDNDTNYFDESTPHSSDDDNDEYSDDDDDDLRLTIQVDGAHDDDCDDDDDLEYDHEYLMEYVIKPPNPAIQLNDSNNSSNDKNIKYNYINNYNPNNHSNVNNIQQPYNLIQQQQGITYLYILELFLSLHNTID